MSDKVFAKFFHFDEQSNSRLINLSKIHGKSQTQIVKDALRFFEEYCDYNKLVLKGEK